MSWNELRKANKFQVDKGSVVVLLQRVKVIVLLQGDLLELWKMEFISMWM